MVQKIDTGGTSKTRTPMFRFLTKVLFPESDALHITHCARVDSAHNAPNVATINAILTMRITLDVLLLRITYPLATASSSLTLSSVRLCRRWRCPLITQIPGAKAVREKDE